MFFLIVPILADAPMYGKGPRSPKNIVFLEADGTFTD